MKKILEKSIAGLLVVIMLASCIWVFPKDAYAADEKISTDTGIVYIEEKDQATVLKHFENNTAPAYPYPKNVEELTEFEKSGYLFGGWFTKVSEDGEEKFRPIKNDKDKTDEEVLKGVEDSGYYAKFVPAYILSVRCQNQLGTEFKGNVTATTKMRYIAGLDSTNYAEVGFIVHGVSFDGTYESGKKIMDQETGEEIYIAPRYTNTEKNLVKTRLAGKNDGDKAEKITTVYENIYVYKSNNAGETQGVKRPASDVFGKGTKYMMTYRLSVSEANFARTYAIQPYWVTFDGVEVKGLTKYAHVEDGINKYINVPINLTSTAEVAAGKLTVDFTKLAKNGYEFMEAECGTVFPEKVVKEETLNEGTATEQNLINCVASVVNDHAESPVENKDSDNIYINLRFKRTDESKGNAYDNRCFVELPVSDVEFAKITYITDGENKKPNGEELLPKTGDDRYKVWDVRF